MGGIGGVTGVSSTVFPAGGRFGLAIGTVTAAQRAADSPQQNPNAANPQQTQDANSADAQQPQDANSANFQQQNASTANSKDSKQQDAKTAALVSQLAQRDRQVRTHEAAHVAAGGMYVRGGARFSYTTGPDGKAYATGGEVKIDRSAVPGDPAATIRKLRQVQQAALAPADPSPQDRSVAAAAAISITQAQLELAQRQLSAYGATANATAATRSASFSATA